MAVEPTLWPAVPQLENRVETYLIWIQYWIWFNTNSRQSLLTLIVWLNNNCFLWPHLPLISYEQTLPNYGHSDDKYCHYDSKSNNRLLFALFCIELKQIFRAIHWTKNKKGNRYLRQTSSDLFWKRWADSYRFVLFCSVVINGMAFNWNIAQSSDRTAIEQPSANWLLTLQILDLIETLSGNEIFN